MTLLSVWVLRLDESQEGGVLGKEILDLRDAAACPVFQPGIRQIVLDPV
jgi:hypothetical protein